MTRATRSAEQEVTRESTARDEVWTPPSLLEAPPARPGFKQRWVATSILGKDIPQQTLKRFREGWAPRDAETVPTDFIAPTMTHGQFTGAIGVEGMILCEMPTSRVQARERYYAQKVRDLQGFVENNLNRVEQQGGQTIARTFDTSVSRGHKIADDE